MKLIRKNWQICSLIIIYFLFRLPNLEGLPIFNDEAIYLHWSQIITNTRQFFFPAFFDGKQPLPIWVFSLAGLFSRNLFLAGRLAVVLIGLGTTLGVFFTAKKLFNQKIAFWMALLYLLVPYVFFFERMALMEGMLNFVAIWSFYLTYSLLEKPQTRLAIVLGVILGMGMWIKSSGIFFVLLAFSSLLGAYFFKKRNQQYLVILFYLIMIFLVIFAPLLFHPSYQRIAQKDLEFRLSSAELFSFPIKNWLLNLQFYSSWLLWYSTPFLLLFGLLGLRKSVLSFWFFLPLLVALIFSRHPTSRYIVLVIPFLVLLVGQILKFLEKRKISFIISLVLLVLPCLFYDLVLLKEPAKFFDFFPQTKAVTADKSQYITSWTSGYGIKSVVDYLVQVSQKEKILVGVRADSGNPESAIFVYLGKNPNIKIFYFPLDESSLKQLTAPEFPYNSFVVTRDNQFGGMEDYLEGIDKFFKPENKNFVGLYGVKKVE